MDEAEAARALAAVRTTRGALAQRARWSIGRHAAVGVVMGGMIAGYALPGGWPIIIAGLCMAATAAIIARDRHRDGFFVSGYRPGRTRRLTFAIVVVALAALVAAIVLKTRLGLAWAPVAIGIAMGILITLGSIAWERVYRRELEEAVDDR